MKMTLVTMLSLSVALMVFALCYWITLLNYSKYAQFLLAIGTLCFILGNLKSPYFAAVLTTVASASVLIFVVTTRAKCLNEWFERNDFRPSAQQNPGELFDQSDLADNATYTCYETKIEEVPLKYVVKRQVNQLNRGVDYDHLSHELATTEIVVHAACVVDKISDTDLLEKCLRQQQNNTPTASAFKMKFHVFDLGASKIFRLKSGELVVSWRIANTIAAHESCFQWLQQAILLYKNRAK